MTDKIDNPPSFGRRNFLYLSTALVGTAGLGAAAWPLIHQMSPDAKARAAENTVEIDLADLAPAQNRVVKWRNPSLPIFVTRRTPAMLAAMQEPSFVARLVDANSSRRQQPMYAKNWHRSIDPAYAVLVGICTSCACVPQYFDDDSGLSMAGGYVCPCCASHFDPAGRAYSGRAQNNLPVPPYELIGKSKVAVGKNASGEIFSIEMVEQL